MLFVPFAIMGLILMFGHEDWLPALPCKAIALFNGPKWITEKAVGPSPVVQIITENMIEEVIIIGLVIALGLIAFSREKDEDEMTGQIRMRSFVWSLWFTTFVLAFGILFIMGLNFLSFCVVALYLYYLVYILKFNLTMRRIRREGR